MEGGPLVAIGTALGTALASGVAALTGKGRIAAVRFAMRNLEVRVNQELEALRAEFAELLARVEHYRKEQREAKGEGGPSSTGRYLAIDADEIRRDSGRDGRLDALEGRIRANEARLERVDAEARATFGLVGEIRGMIEGLRERRDRHGREG